MNVVQSALEAFPLALNMLGALSLGALGWLALEFFGRPLRGFFDLRRQVKKQMLRFENVKKPTIPANMYLRPYQADVQEAQIAFRDLSTELIAFGQSEWFAAYIVRCLGLDPIAAGDSLAKVAKEFGNHAEDRPMRYRTIEKALKF